jgi:hypothetical protein
MVETDLEHDRPGESRRIAIADHSGAPSGGAASAPPPRAFGLHRIPILVLAIGLTVTAVLAFTARSVHDNNENHLLRQRVNEAVAVLTAALSSTQAPLSSAAILAEATNADRGDFTGLMQSLTAGAPYVSASLWPTGESSPRPLVVVGLQPELAERPAAAIRDYFARAEAKPTVAILDLLGSTPRRLGYAFSTGPNARYVVYAESNRPANRRSTVDSNTAFSDLDYAIYLGDKADAGHLLASSVADPRFGGRTVIRD